MAYGDKAQGQGLTQLSCLAVALYTNGAGQGIYPVAFGIGFLHIQLQDSIIVGEFHIEGVIGGLSGRVADGHRNLHNLTGGYRLVFTKGNGVALIFRSFNGDGQLTAGHIVRDLNLRCTVITVCQKVIDFHRKFCIGSICTLFCGEGKGCPITCCKTGMRRIILIKGRLQIGDFYCALIIGGINIRKAETGRSTSKIFPSGERVGICVKTNGNANGIRNKFLIQTQSQRYGLTRGNRGFVCAQGDGRFVCCKDGRYQAQDHCQCQQHRNQFFHVDLFPPLFSSTFQPEIP